MLVFVRVVGVVVCECVRLGVVRLTFQGPSRGNRIASHPIAPHPIAPHRTSLSFSFSFDTMMCDIVPAMPHGLAWPEQQPQPHCRHIPPP